MTTKRKGVRLLETERLMRRYYHERILSLMRIAKLFDCRLSYVRSVIYGAFNDAR